MRPTMLHSRRYISRGAAPLESSTGLRSWLFVCRRYTAALGCFAALLLFAQTALSQSQVAWNFAGPVGAPPRVLSVTADPRDASVLYVVTPGGGIWKTPNTGGVWTPLSESFPSLQVCSLSLDPGLPDVLYAGTGDDQNPRPLQGVARSDNGGQSWKFGARFTNQPVCAIAADPARAGRVLAGSAEGLFLSVDSGNSWSKVLGSPVTSIGFDGQGNAFAGILSSEVLVRSTDGGRTWSAIAIPSNPYSLGTPANWVSVSAGSGTLALVVSYPETAGSGLPSQLDFYRTADGGSTWTTAFRIGQARPPVQLLTGPSSGNFTVAGNTLLTSTNDGLTWQTISTLNREFHVAAFSTGMVLVGGEKGLEAVSTVSGTPPPVIANLPAVQLLGVGVDSANGIWTAGPAGLFNIRSRTDLTTIRASGVGAVGNVTAAAAGSFNVFAAGNNQVFRSSDGGAHFSASSVLPAGELRAPYPPVLLDTVTTTAYVGGRRLYRTTDSGATWTALALVDSDPNRAVTAIASAPTSRLILYAATACLPEVALVACPATSFIWRSTNGGQTWVQTSPSPVAGFVNRIAVDPRQPNTIYAAIGGFPGGPSTSAGYVNGDLLQSTNGGGVWTSIRANLPQVPVNDVVIGGASLPPLILQPAQTLYAGTDAGVFVSFNGGVQWTDLTGSAVSSLPAAPVTDLYLQQQGGILFAATFGRGLYWTSTAGLTPTMIARPLSLDATLMQGGATTTGITFTNLSATSPASWLLSPAESWIEAPLPSGILPARGSVQAAVRISAADLQPGYHIGDIKLVSGAFVQNIVVKLRVTAAPAQLKFVGGDRTTSPVGTGLAVQVIVSDASDLPQQGVAVTFAITTGGGSLSFRTAQSNASGLASAFVTLPSTPGTVHIIASSGRLSSTLVITVVPAPVLIPDAVFDGVTFNGYTYLGPGSVISLIGRNLAAGSAAAGTASLPTTLLSTRAVLASGQAETALPLFMVSPFQIRALLPPDLPPGFYKLRVEVASIRSNEVDIPVAAFGPGIFTRNDRGRGPGIFLKDDGSLVTASNPADRGTQVTFYAAGLGAVNARNGTLVTPRVFFDIYQAEVSFSGLAAGIAGRYQVTVRVPAQLSPSANVSVSMTIAGFASNRVTIPVR